MSIQLSGKDWRLSHETLHTERESAGEDSGERASRYSFNGCSFGFRTFFVAGNWLIFPQNQLTLRLRRFTLWLTQFDLWLIQFDLKFGTAI